MAESNKKPVILDKAEQRIKGYLDEFASKDELFKAKYKPDNESIHKCRIYIEEQVRKVSRMMWDDEEIFGMAIHYFEEGLSPTGNTSSANIATTGFTPEEIQKEMDSLSDKRKEELTKKAEEMFFKKQIGILKSVKASSSPASEVKPKADKTKVEKPKAEHKPKKNEEPIMLDLFAGID